MKGDAKVLHARIYHDRDSKWFWAGLVVEKVIDKPKKQK